MKGQESLERVSREHLLNFVRTGIDIVNPTAAVAYFRKVARLLQHGDIRAEIPQSTRLAYALELSRLADVVQAVIQEHNDFQVRQKPSEEFLDGLVDATTPLPLRVDANYPPAVAVKLYMLTALELMYRGRIN